MGDKKLFRRFAMLYRVVRGMPAGFRRQSLLFLYSVLRERPELLPEGASLVALGLHFCQFSAEHVVPQLDRELADLEERERSSRGLVAAAGQR